jgi:hypothetical protein
VPATTVGLQAARRAHALHATDLPRLRELRARLHEEAQDWCGAPLALALKAHAAAAAAVRFDLLVAPGLRAGPTRQDEDIFRAQVEEVSTCTEITWLQLRDVLVQDTGGDSMAPAAMDFVMGSRAIQREVAQVAQAMDLLRATLETGPGGPGSDAVLERLRESARLLVPVARACEGAGAVQKAVWRLADRQRASRDAFEQLAQVLRGGLLLRLGALLEPGAFPGSGELADAEQARDALVTCLHEAVRRLDAVRAAQDDLLAALEAMEA